MRIPSKSDLFASDNRGFRTYWLVDGDYALREGVITPLVDGEPAQVYAGSSMAMDPGSTGRSFVKRYLPMTRPELPFEFAKLAEGSGEAILRFVRHYGLLGYREAFETTLSIYKEFEFLVNTPEGEEDSPPSTVPDFGQFYHEGIRYGDPLSWILSHAETVSFVVNLYGALSDKQKLRVMIEALEERNERREKLLKWKYAQRGDLYRHSQVIVDPPSDDPQECARYIIAWTINQNLDGGVSRKLIIDLERSRAVHLPHRERAILNAFQAKSLMDCIYWHLADAIAGGTVKPCLFCGKFFNATSLKRMYCPPPMGYDGDGPCAQNDRARRKRLRDKQEKQAPKPATKKGGARGRISSRKTKGKR